MAERTGKKAASNASKVLQDGRTSTSSKAAAGSALSQTGNNKKTGSSAAKAASKTLQDKSTGKASKSAAGSALTQHPGKKGKK